MNGFRGITAVAFLLAMGSFLVIGITHVRYPGFTEPMEGDVLQHIERASDGLPIYPVPDPEYIALSYMPFYYVSSVPFYRVLGDSFAGPRLLSLLAALGSAILVGRIATRESGSITTGFLAMACFGAGYRVMDACLFCALPDAYLLFWLLLGYWFWAYGTTTWQGLAWMLCFTLAYWTKQHGAFFFGAMVLYSLVYRNSSLPRWSLVAGLLIGGPIAYAVLGPIFGEHFHYHTFTVPGRWKHEWSISLKRTIFILLSSAPIAIVSALVLVRNGYLAGARRPSPLAWFTATALGTALVTMSAVGSSNNHYVPLMAMFCVIIAVHAHKLVSQSEGVSDPLAAPPERQTMISEWGWLSIGFGIVFLLATPVTLVALRNYPNHEIPTFAPIAVGLVAIGLGLLTLVRPGWRGVLAAGILIIGQFMVSYYWPGRYLPSSDWPDSLHDFQEELAHLDHPPIWVNYGNVPSELTRVKLTRAPSWVVMEDVDRQEGHPVEAEADLIPLRTRLHNGHKMLLLTDEAIESIPVWNTMAGDVELVRDYGKTFAGIHMIADHWYGGGSYPRYVYRVK